LAGGEGGNTLAYSTDGIRWVGLGATTLSTRTNDIAYNGYVWVIVGSGVTANAYVSIDGLGWTAATGMAAEGQRVKWNGNIFVATAKNGSIYYSNSGTTWVAGQTTAATDFNALDWNGVFWLAGGNVANTLYKSFDGVTWSAITPITMTNIRSVAWTGGKWLVNGTVASGNASAYSTTFDASTSWVTFDVSGITSGVTSTAYNNQIYVAAGITSGNSLAYSYDSVNWTPLGNTTFDGTSGYMQVKWANNKFVAVGQGTTSRIAYSYEGTRWTVISGLNTTFTTGVKAIEYGSTMPNRVVFPANATISGNQISRDGGVTWSTITGTSTTTINAVGFNGRNYIFGGTSNTSYLTGDIYGNPNVRNNYIPLNFSSDPSGGINAIKWNGSYWLMGGLSTTGRALLRSADGVNWFSTGSGFASNQPCNGIAWNGNTWVVSSQTNANGSATNMIYSTDSINWTQSSTTQGGGTVEWTGYYFMAGGPYDVSGAGANTYVSTSSDGITWVSRIISATNGNVKAIAYNGSSWVVATDGRSAAAPGLLYSSDGTTFTAVGPNSSYTGVTWNGLTWVAITNGNNIRYSYDGQTWTTVAVTGVKGNAIWTKPLEGTAIIYAPTVVVGQGASNGMAYSYDGVNYIGLGTTVFSVSNHVFYNGSLWVGGGTGNNTLAYSYDGKVWVGLGKTVFTAAVNNVTYNGTVWLACGSGGNTLATSPDGKVWTGLGSTIFTTQANAADWNGTAWVAVGQGGNTLAYSTLANASSWTGLGATTFTTGGNDIQWMLNKWFAVGQGGNVMASTSTVNGSTGWAAVASGNAVFTGGAGLAANAIAWNGRTAVVVGNSNNNTIGISTDGVTWTGKGITTFSNQGYDVYWNERLWVLAGAGGNSLAYSFDMSNIIATPGSTTLFATGCFGIGTNSKTGTYVVNNNVYLRQGDKVMVRGPEAYDSSLISDTSISFQLSQIP
jgi:hypothetical protein